MDMNLCADCGSNGIDAMTFAMGAAGALVCFALGAGLALLSGRLSRSMNLPLLAVALVPALLLALALASSGLRPALLFPLAFMIGEGLTLRRMYQNAA